jgi:hypothetical protein
LGTVGNYAPTPLTRGWDRFRDRPRDRFRDRLPTRQRLCFGLDDVGWQLASGASVVSSMVRHRDGRRRWPPSADRQAQGRRPSAVAGSSGGDATQPNPRGVAIVFALVCGQFRDRAMSSSPGTVVTDLR